VGALASAEAATSSSSVRFKALSIADIAAETGSVAEFCFTIAVRLIPSAPIVI
jgi:hypothetical protein